MGLQNQSTLKTQPTFNDPFVDVADNAFVIAENHSGHRSNTATANASTAAICGPYREGLETKGRVGPNIKRLPPPAMT